VIAPLYQRVTGAAYSLAASPQVKWPASMRSSVLVDEVGHAVPPLPDNDAPQPARAQGRGADVAADNVRRLEPERVGDANEECTHRPW
jgi:hypothetical protein